ncbi:hypothetical protein ABE096_22180 [Robertmurraya massiliosenegalensis]|uniref:hypothetical protein n=1 Tax=Robertmurraya TaxID=2837507 RepID=UPI0039A49367
MNKKEREIKGMYYVESVKNVDPSSDINRWYLLMDPSHYIVTPVFDYLKYLYDAGETEDKLKQTVDSLCHFYNFLRVNDLSGYEELTHDILNGYIRYLATIPKDLKRRIKRDANGKELWDIEYLPVHPYIENGEHVIKILKEWYKDYWSKGNKDNVTFYFDPKEYYVYEDELEWRYSFESIKRFVNETLNYLKYLSNSVEWNHSFKAINEKVAKCNLRYNRHSRVYYYAWDVEGRIKNYAKVNEVGVERQKKRVFFETELVSFFQAEMLQNHSQRKFLFVLLLLCGGRISEILNLLLRKITITIPRNALTTEKKKSLAIIHWEDLFITNGFEKNDIVITEDLEFKIKVVKRPAYESKLRRNKTKTSRFPTLKDYFDIPKLLNLDIESIFNQPEEIVSVFRDAIILNKKENDIRGFIKSIMEYHGKCVRENIDIDSNLYDYQYKDWVLEIRKLIDNSWFGGLFREYLIERHLIQKENKNPIHRDFLFVYLKINKGNPMTSKFI